VLGRATRIHLGVDYSRTLANGSGEFGLIDAYQNEAYLQTKLSAGRISLKDPQGVDASAGIIVSYVVSPGPLYNWNGVSWSGNQTLPEGDLTKLLQFKIGEIARQDKVNMGWAAVQDAYKKLGYLQIQVVEKPEFDAAQHQVLFHAAIEEGPQYHMGQFTVTGVAEPLASKLKAAWKLHTGDVYDNSYIKTFLLSGVMGSVRTSQPAKPLAPTFNSKINPQTHIVDVELQLH
jgi:outer membrane protein assembly factor BamA